MNHTINDRFMNPNIHGYPVVPFKLDGDKTPRLIYLFGVLGDLTHDLWVKHHLPTQNHVKPVEALKSAFMI